MLEFSDVTLLSQNIIKPFLYRYGQNSCQHSFAAMYTMKSKYGDRFATEDDILFIKRTGKCTEEDNIYLAPMCERKKLRKGIELILEDARAEGKKAVFETVTETDAGVINELFPDTFELTDCRDYYEYIYLSDKLEDLPGHELASKRYDINTFYREYGGRVSVCPLEEDVISEVRKFQEEWLSEKFHDSDEDVQLILENEAIGIGLDNFEELGLRGLVVYIDDIMVGYCYGVPISDDCFDVLIEKGDRTYKDIYKILNRELVVREASGFMYINREEDVGVPGLRKAKLSYKPDILLPKMVLKEKR